MTLRPYQLRALDDLRAAYRAGARAPLLVLPTGAGKTRLAIEALDSAAKRGLRSVFLVHRRELLRQSVAGFEAQGIRVGKIAAGRLPSPAAIQVAMVGTLARRIRDGKAPPPPDLIIVDEAHHAPAGQWRTVVDAYPNARLLGLTATPCRLDGRPLAAHFDALVQGPTVRELQALGFLSGCRVLAPPSALDMTGVRRHGGDYARGETARRVDRPVITGDAVKHYSRHAPGRAAVAFCCSIEHAEHVAAEFRRAGFRACAVSSKTAMSDRDAAIAALGARELHVLASCDIVSEGTDVPVLEVAILLRPTESLALYLQQVGRALRPSPGKDRALVLDHVGNCKSHGLPTWEREWSLAEGAPPRPKDGTIMWRQCPKCFAIHSPGPVCPECRHVYTTADRIPRMVAGELVEISPEEEMYNAQRELEREAAEREERRRRRREEAAAMQAGMGALVALGRKRGYKHPGYWARQRMEARRARA